MYPVFHSSMTEPPFSSFIGKIYSWEASVPQMRLRNFYIIRPLWFPSHPAPIPLPKSPSSRLCRDLGPALTLFSILFKHRSHEFPSWLLLVWFWGSWTMVGLWVPLRIWVRDAALTQGSAPDLSAQGDSVFVPKQVLSTKWQCDVTVIWPQLWTRCEESSLKVRTRIYCSQNRL